MLIKLMRHEFRATGRVMLPLYLILLITAVGANITSRVLMRSDIAMINILGGLLITAFVIAIIGVCVMSMVVMVRRFYKNLLQDEGYVMMTLPVSVHQQVWSKLIVSAVWFALTFIAVVLSFLIVAYEVGMVRAFLDDLVQLLEQITAYYALNGTAILVEFLVLGFAGCCSICLQFYAALSIGHSFARHKLAWSVLFYFVLQFVMQLLGSFLLILLDESPLYDLLQSWDIHFNVMAGIHLGMGVIIFAVVVYSAIHYFLTMLFLKKHLNLE